MPAKKKMKILNAVSEVVPFLATGGMGQVAGALAASLAENDKSLDMRIIAPLYAEFRDKYEPQMKFLGATEVQLAWRTLYCGVFELVQDGVTFYFIDNRRYFDRENAYGYVDDGERFAFFSKAVFASIEITKFVPHVIHSHDWQTALVPIYLKTHYAWKYYDIRTVFTIHNMEYQGQMPGHILHDVFDLSDEDASIVWYHNCINLMKGAIICADKVTTVSPSYAEEIQENGGYGLEPIIRENAYKLSGIINGIDTKTYNPETDKLLGKNTYSVENLKGKKACKKKLQTLFNLPHSPRTMLICIVSRLVSHKGIDLITLMLDDLIRMDVQFLLLGTGEHAYELFFEEKAIHNPDKVAVSIAYNPDIAGMIFAGADVLLMPSRSEPCGLAQMIACRYGTIPIVRNTGGLGDTIYDCRLGTGNGFVFDDYNARALMETVISAQDLYANHEADWLNLVREAMQFDFSWNQSAKAYSKLYRELDHR
ncbi:MAG: glycogen synthase [Oscillospiraceae bacterium]|jgi:starch synthase|nr:glycogen synthase [Oscillospiraceae bacterium]